MPLRVTTWNIKHARKLLGAAPSDSVQNRRSRVRETVEEIDPDILCLVEGPKGEAEVMDFCADVLGGQWSPVLLRGPGDALGDRDSDYGIRGTQWMWFLARPALADQCRLQTPIVWQSFIGEKTWDVHFWGRIETERHSHYRHPQVMIFELPNGEEVEFIAVHFKSKINRKSITRDAEGNLTGEYLDEALKARIKLATEAVNLRAYVGAKFAQLASPGLVLLGDCNDGPGQDFFETEYLFFDLIQNLQGEVLVAEKSFNHALFDFDGDLRWTARFRDEILGLSASENPLLLDHVLMSQPLCDGSLSLQANAGAGSVEHEAFERVNAGSNSKTRSSDHRPVTCRFDDNQP